MHAIIYELSLLVSLPFSIQRMTSHILLTTSLLPTMTKRSLHLSRVFKYTKTRILIISSSPGVAL